MWLTLGRFVMAERMTSSFFTCEHDVLIDTSQRITPNTASSTSKVAEELTLCFRPACVYHRAARQSHRAMRLPANTSFSMGTIL